MIQQTQQLINNRYRIRETIGQGGFGTTYKAEDISHPQNKLCVIKQFTFQGNSKGTALELFRQEAEHLKALGTHDQIPTLIDCFDENGQVYCPNALVKTMHFQCKALASTMHHPEER